MTHIQNKRHIAGLFCTMICMIGVCTMLFAGSAFAKPLIDLPPVNGIPNIENQGNVSFLTFLTKDNGLIAVIKTILEAIAIIFIVFYGIEMIFAMGKEDSLSKAKSGITYALIGFVILNVGSSLVDFFNPVKEEIVLKIDVWKQMVGTVITGIRYLIGSIAVFFLIISGFRMVTAGGKEDVINRHKTQVIWSSMGLILVAMSGSLVDIFYGAKTDISPIVSVTNLMLLFTVPVGVFFLILGGFYMITAHGNDTMLNKGKKILQSTIIAMVIIYSSYTFITEILKFST